MARLYYLTRHCPGCVTRTVHARNSSTPNDYYCVECHEFKLPCTRCGKNAWHCLNFDNSRLRVRCLTCTHPKIRASRPLRTRPLSPLNIAVRKAILRSVKSGETYTSIALGLGVTVTRVRRHVDKINAERKRDGMPPLKGFGAPPRKLTDAERTWLREVYSRLNRQNKKVNGAVLAKMLLGKYGKRVHKSTINRNLNTAEAL
jgi:hypothetical protein